MFDNKNYAFLQHRWKNICKGNSSECVSGHLFLLEHSVCSAGSGSRAALTRSATWCQLPGLSVSPAAQHCLCSQKAQPSSHSASKSCALIYLALLNCLGYLLSFYRLVLQQWHSPLLKYANEFSWIMDMKII